MRLYTLVLAFMAAISCYAQNITGTVKDSGGNPVQFANVVLMLDSTFVDGRTTDDNGAFSFVTPPQNANTIKITALGFDDYISAIPHGGDCGSIVLTESTVKLQEVVVNASLPTTRLSGNAMITTVSNSILSSAGTANDVLSKIPLVNGSDGKYKVFGRGTPSIYINGRLVRDAAELEQLNSKDIKSVEVISNPGSKYSSETKAVIIIRTVPPKGEGFSVSVLNSTRIAHCATNTDNALLKYRHNGLEIFSNLYFYGGKVKSSEDDSFTTYGKDLTYLSLKDYTSFSMQRYSGKFGFNQQIGTAHSLGAYYQYNSMRTKTSGRSESELFYNQALTERLSQSARGIDKGRPYHEANIYYNGRIGKLDVDFNADFMQTERHKESQQIETTDKSDVRNVETHSDNTGRLWAEKLTFSLPVGTGNLEFGEEFTNSCSDFNSRNIGVDISGGNARIKENNIAAFAQVSQRFGSFQVGAGLRFEHADYKYFDDGRLNSELSKTYTNLYPSLFMSTKIKNVGISFNFTSRTRRPTYRQLDGTLNYAGRYVYQQGDPALKPAKSYTAQVMAQWKYFFAQAIYTYEKNSIFFTTEKFNGDPVIKLISYGNVPKYEQLQIAIGAQPSVGCWHPQITLGLVNSFYTATFRGRPLHLNKPLCSVNWNNAVVLPHDWVIDVDLMAQSSGDTQNCHIEAISYLNLGVRKSFLKKSLTLMVKANDIFNRNINKSTLYNDDVASVTHNFEENRNVVITLQYRFNTTRSKYKGTGAGNEERSRF